MKTKAQYKDILDKNFDKNKTNVQNAKDLQELLGVSVSRGRRIVAAYLRDLPLTESKGFAIKWNPQTAKHEIETFPGSGKFESYPIVEDEDIVTPQQLLNRAEVDPSKFRVRSQKIDKSVSGKIGVSVTLEPTEEVDYKSEIADMLNAWSTQSKTAEVVYNIKPSIEHDSHLLVINCFDVHFGKVSNPEITGQTYNLEVAKKLFFNTVYEIAVKAFYRYGISEVVLCTGGDFFNSDTTSYTTTGGTPQHGDGNSYQRVFTEGCNAVIETLEMLSGLAAKVTFININGNHDRMSSYCLGEVVRTYFSKSDKVVVDNAPHLRKYYSFGENCFMFTHGDKAVDRLPLIFAREYKQFSMHQFPNIFLGHYHKTDKKFFGGESEYNGINVRTFNSISAADAWHHEEGYVGSIRKADGLIYSKTDGKVGEINQIIK